jgi:hypothetical protein
MLYAIRGADRAAYLKSAQTVVLHHLSPEISPPVSSPLLRLAQSYDLIDAHVPSQKIQIALAV